MSWYQRLDMWFTLVVVGLMAYLWARDRLRGLLTFAGARFEKRQIAVETTPGRAVKPIRQLTGVRPTNSKTAHVIEQAAPHSAWWPDVRRHDGHIMIVGETRSGKSTLARALLADRAITDHIVIVDPHATLNDWGVDAVGSGRNFDAIADVLHAVHREFERRFQVGVEIGDRLTVFIDEYPAIVAARPDVAGLVKQWLREAAKARISLVFLCQDASVRTLGIEGEGAVRRNVWTILLGSFAASASPIAAQQGRPAVLQRATLLQAVDVRNLPGIARISVSPLCLWEPVPVEMLENMPVLPDGTGTELEPVPEPVTLGEKRAAAIRRGKTAGMSNNDLAALIGGNRAAALEMIRQATAE